MQITGGNVNDCSPIMELVKDISAKLIGDKGYISKKLSAGSKKTYKAQQTINLMKKYLFSIKVVDPILGSCYNSVVGNKLNI